MADVVQVAKYCQDLCSRFLDRPEDTQSGLGGGVIGHMRKWDMVCQELQWPQGELSQIRVGVFTELFLFP